MKTPEQMAEEYERFNWCVNGLKSAFLAGYQAAKDQLADFSKVMCNTTMEEIKAVDTGEIIPITNLPTSAKWISVKDRLPDNALEVIAISNGKSTAFLHKLAYCRWIIDETITHWMPLPEAPKEEK